MQKVRIIGSNKTEVQVNDRFILISYETPVAAFLPGQGIVRESVSSSRTTAKHINQWIGNAFGDGVTQRYVPREDIAKLLEPEGDYAVVAERHPDAEDGVHISEAFKHRIVFNEPPQPEPEPIDPKRKITIRRKN